MGTPRIILTGFGTNLAGLTWESDHLLRIGREPTGDVVVRDFTVHRFHAEIRHHGLRWILHDLAQSPMYPTLVNNVPLETKEQTLNLNDIVQIGKAQLKVIHLETECAQSSVPWRMPSRASIHLPREEVKGSNAHLRVEVATQQSWDQALDQMTASPGQSQPQNKAVRALIRVNHHLTHVSQQDDLLRSILSDAITALQAQRGSILLADPATGELTLKATLTPKPRPGAVTTPYSQTLVDRCFRTGESVLCQDADGEDEVLLTRRVRHGMMASIICAVLRTPRQRLGVLHLDRGVVDDRFTESDLYSADAFAASASVGIETAQLIDQQHDQFLKTVTKLACAAETRNQYGEEHVRRVTDFSLLLATELHLSPAEKYHIRVGTPLRDIGKLGIDDAVLRKPGKLTSGEFEHMKTHTTKGAGMVDSMFQMMPMIPIIRHHHERWDGSGYPDGLARDDIPILARIVSVADAFDAMTSDRPYRPALAMDHAMLELIGQAGTHFDPACVYAFLRARDKIQTMRTGSVVS